jgi:hypothetical protein
MNQTHQEANVGTFHDPVRRANNPPLRQKQLQIISLRWRTIEIEEQTGRERKSASKMRIADMSERWMLPTPPPIRPAGADAEIKNLASVLGCDPVKTN